MISVADKGDYSRLLELWESAVKNTHHFLKPSDFEFYKTQIPIYLDDLELYIYKDDLLKIRGFIGISGSKVEMLFVDNTFRGLGIGTELMNFVINELSVNKVDVNEQNEQALKFYLKLGFKIVKRSDIDEQGKAYPILHLERPTLSI